MQTAIGAMLVCGGVLLWLASRRERLYVPANLPRLGIGIASLGAGSLALTQSGLAWYIASSCFSLIAIALIGSVALDNLRRPRR